ncbi:MAG TPA: hypothetical protein VHQ66_14215 [Myxococcota bacterium]|nr:hypothetical protein [Myxococcota bacterium]
MSARAALALAAALAAAAVACGPREEPAREDAAARVAPATIQGGVIIEPPELGIGDTATVEIAIVTPPDHRVAPLAAPESVPGLWVLSAETLPVRHEPGRLVHRTRFLVRARATGEFAWPAQEAQVETPDGARVPLALAARPLRVLSVARELSERTTPFGFREPREPGRVRGFLLPAVFGAAAALAALGLAGYARRSRRPAASPAPAPPAPESLAAAPARAAQSALAGALARLEREPVEAANAASVALRGFVEHVTGVPASRATTEELAAIHPPFLLETRWTEWLTLLGALDAARFRAAALDTAAARAALAAQLRTGAELVARAPGARS